MTPARPRPRTAPNEAREPTLRERVFRIVSCIPRGRVASYGQIAALCGAPRAARAVGWALASLPEGNIIPWQRVVNAAGRISPRAEPGWDAVQRAMLEAEGVELRADGSIDIARFGWNPEIASGS